MTNFWRRSKIVTSSSRSRAKNFPPSRRRHKTLSLASGQVFDTLHFAVKVGIPAGDDSSEFFWISPFEPRGGKYTGRINNTPRMVKTVKLGQTIEFSEDEIVDWLYTEDGKMRGNFTACAMLKHEPPDQVEAVKREFGLSCDP